MAIFLSRIKRALNVGSKSITANGTYYASADGYDGYSDVTVNVSGGSATPITPSNANPVALTSGVAVQPTANGYAIQSFDSVTPSSTPASVASGDIVKIGGSGVIVDSVPSPTSVTPSDSTPPQLSQGNIYEPTANGYLYESNQSPTETVLWTNNSPTSQFASQTITLSDDYSNYDYIEVYFRCSTSDDTEYREIIPKATLDKSSSLATFTIGNNANTATRARGIYADTTSSLNITSAYPLSGSSSANSYVIPTKIVGISVALPPSVGNVKVGTFTNADGVTTTVTCGFKPKKIFIYGYEGANSYYSGYYDEDVNSTYYVLGYRTSSSSTSAQKYTIGGGTKGTIDSITNTGFTWYGSSTWATRNYVAIG